ncbi:MAG: flagellar hook-basal body protein [Erysipelotrichaceae bacterium]
MSTAFYNAAQAMLVQQKKLNTMGNNLANIKTSGYKSEQVLVSTFDETLKLRVDANGKTQIGTGYARQQVDGIHTNFTQGDLQETERALDVAIGGDGFFQISSGNQTYLTRNGSFALDLEGYLVLPGVGRVMGRVGEIQLENDRFTINAQGQIFDENNQFVDQLWIVAPENLDTLEKQPNGMYLNRGALDLELTTPLIFQGALEGSNVDVNQETSNLIEVQRNFQSMANTLKAIDQIDAKTVSEIGKI